METIFTATYRTVRHSAIGALVFVSAFLQGCTEPPGDAERELRQWVEQGQTAAEAKQRRELLGTISSAYKDARGNDRAAINSLLRVYFLRQHRIALLTSIEDIRVFGDTAAEIDMTVGFTGTNDGTFGFSASAYEFSLELQRNGGEWQLISAKWGALGEALH